MPHPCLPRLVALASVLVLASAIATCGKDTTGPKRAGPAALMEIVAGDRQSAQVGTELPSPLIVRVLDAQSRVVAGQVVNFRVTAGGGSVFAGVGMTSDSGLVQERWTLGTSTADSQRVEARAVDNVTGAPLTFATFAATALPGPPSHLAFATRPGPVAAGAVIAPAVQVTVLDSYGNTVTSSNATVSVAITAGTGPAGGTLGGTTSRAAVNGLATFGDLTIDKAAGSYTLTASAAGLTSATSSAFAVSPGAAAKLAFGSHPTTTTAGATITPAVQVFVQDALGNTVAAATPAVTLGITSGTGTTGAILSGTTTQQASAGVAAFGNLSVAKAGSGYSLTAMSTGLADASSNSFDINVGQAARLSFTVQPSDVVAGAAIAPAVQVTVQDAQGNAVTSATTSITLSITSGTGTGGAVLGGTLTQAAVAGVATFSGTTFDKAGTGYTLTATATSLTSATSSAFAVSPGAAAKLVFTVQPGSAVVAGAAMSPPVQVTVQDALANTVTGSAANVTLGITSGTGTTGAVLGGTLTRAAVNGVATFADLTLDRIGTDYTLTATSGSLASAISTAVEATSPMTVSGVTPTNGPMAGGTTVTIAGTGFVNITAVTVGGIALAGMNVVSVTQITGLSPANASFGARDVVVVSSVYGTATCAGCYRYNPWAASLSAGNQHTCGLTGGGAAYCWGADSTGQLGDGTTGNRSSPVAVLGGLVFQDISAGGGHSCGLTTGGAAYCWGADSTGQLGDGASSTRSSPVAVSGGLVFRSISAGDYHTCGLTTGGAVYCWGANSRGQLGDGTTDTRTGPVAVSGDLTFQTLSAGGYHTCGLTTSGAAYCWGDNSLGKLGDGTTTDRWSPAAVSGGLTFQALSAGGAQTCGLTTGGAAYCWGWIFFQSSSSPMAVGGGLTFQALSAGDYHTCALTATGAAYCWGIASKGQLGNGSIMVDKSSPVAVLGSLVFRSISAGSEHTCGVTTGGTAYCWGSNASGQLGTPIVGDRSATPVAVANP